MRTVTRLLILLLLLCIPPHSLACEDCYPKTVTEVVGAYLREDFTRGPNYWNRISKYTTWDDAPGWDETILVSGFRIYGVTETAKYAKVEVEYYDPTIYFIEEAGPVIQYVTKSETVVFKLVSKDGCWKIEAPQSPPHLNVDYIIEDLQLASKIKYSERDAKVLHQLMILYKK